MLVAEFLPALVAGVTSSVVRGHADSLARLANNAEAVVAAMVPHPFAEVAPRQIRCAPNAAVRALCAHIA